MIYTNPAQWSEEIGQRDGLGFDCNVDGCHISASVLIRRGEPNFLVNWGCCNKLPLIGWLLNNRNLFLTVLEAESLRWGVSTVGFQWGSSSGFQCQLLIVSSPGRKRRREFSGVPFIRTTKEALLSWLNHLPKQRPPLPNTNRCIKLGFQHMKWRWTKHLVHSSPLFSLTLSLG